MALTPTVTIDPAKVYALIEKQEDLPQSPQSPHSGKKTAFARKIGRHPKTILNLKHIPVLSVRFATQIADALGVDLSEITAPAEDDEQDAAPQAENRPAA